MGKVTVDELRERLSDFGGHLEVIIAVEDPDNGTEDTFDAFTVDDFAGRCVITCGDDDA